jgi:hypothetical protein
MGYIRENPCLDARKVEESHHPTPKATTTITPRRKATSREDIGKKGFYLTDFTYGLSAYTKIRYQHQLRHERLNPCTA